MTVKELRQSAKETVDNLPLDRLKVAVEFLRYLDERVSEDATKELLKMPGLLEEIEDAEREITAGKAENWRKVRDDV